MKHRWRIVSGVLCAFVINCTYAQQKDTVGRGEEEKNDFDKKLGSDIEDFINRMTDRWENGWKDSGYSDTVETKKEMSPSDSTIALYKGDVVIRAGDTVRTGVFVKDGNCMVLGCVEGDVTVRQGSILVKEGGRIRGNAHVTGGSIVKEEGGVIDGYEERTGLRRNRWRPSKERMERKRRTFDVPWADEQGSIENFILRYNRVEGFFFGLAREKKYYWDGYKDWNAYGFGGWGVKSHTWRGELGLARQFPFRGDEANGIVELGAEIYSLTDTKDLRVVSLNENSAAALFMHEDFLDYFQREGYAFHAAYYSKSATVKQELSFAYRIDRYESLRNNVDWALFGGGKWFRENPAIDEGGMRSMLLTAGLSTAVREKRNTEGWVVFGTAEYAKKDFGGNFDFDRYVIDARRFQPLGGYDGFNIRLRAGSSAGTLPAQKTFELGGIGTMNAFPFQSEIGNRMILVNAEYIVDGRILDDIDFLDTWFFRGFNFILLSDAGLCRTSPSDASALEGFRNITWGEFRHDFGVAVGNRDGSFRVGIAWRTDCKEKAQFLLRCTRPF
jgi:hypothetical protein